MFDVVVEVVHTVRVDAESQGEAVRMVREMNFGERATVYRVLLAEQVKET